MHFAHSLEGRPIAEWEPLQRHLEFVAEGDGEFPGAAGFAAAFGAREWGRLLGWWHDVGKYLPEFQRRLHGEAIQVEHAGVGAALAASKGAVGKLLAFAIAGHHTGLANHRSNASAEETGQTGAALPKPLDERLRANRPLLDALRGIIPAEFLNLPLPPPPPLLCGSPQDRLAVGRTAEFWVRMLFSALVDADRLATAMFLSERPADQSDVVRYDGIHALRARLDAFIDAKAAAARRDHDSAVNRLRADVLAACRAAAEQPPGRFSLTVPTGGGKSLAALSFALRHAERHGLRRTIVVIPFTSIIEQNAARYREALNAPSASHVDHVLEHHSNLDEEALAEDPERESRRKLAAENWDAPVVVTTAVQFFESLFSNHPSRCRKLHNAARSVLILDEVQTVPPQYLDPILDVLRELTEHYGCSLVLSTATPPALEQTPQQPYGLTDVRPIMPDAVGLARRARRVRVRWPGSAEVTPYTELACQLARHDRVLAIVHRRRDARVLAEFLPAEGRFHLSALMCPAHRLLVLKQIERQLRTDAPCRVVATQLVEAGVDLDFPVVYRALAGLDSLAQAAGRCDREGLRTQAAASPAGEFVIFRAETPPPPGVLRKALQTTETLLGLRGHLDLLDPDVCREFFQELYGKIDGDQAGIQCERQQWNFATTALKFRMIEDGYSRPIVVPWGDALARIDAFRSEPGRRTLKALQPFLVNIPVAQHDALLASGAIERLYDQADVPTSLFGSRYSPMFGLDPIETGLADPGAMVV